MDEKANISNNTEIDKALKEFEAGSLAQPEQKIPQAPKVSEISKADASGVSFEADSYKVLKFYNETKAPKIVELVMKYSGGAIKGQRQAEYVLLALAVVMFIVSAYLFFGKTITSPISLPGPTVEEMLLP